MTTVEPHRVRAGRGIELGLLLLALAIGIAAYALVGLGVAGEVPPDVVGLRRRPRRRWPSACTWCCAGARRTRTR